MKYYWCGSGKIFVVHKNKYWYFKENQKYKVTFKLDPYRECTQEEVEFYLLKQL